MAVLVAAVYANAIHGPFLFDDQSAIEQNLTIRRFWPISVPLNPPVQTPLTGRPLPNLTFAVNYALGGLNVEGYHLVNIACHLLVGLVLFGVLRRTFERSPLFGGTSLARNAAAVCALLWLVHPLNTEAVDYVTQRTELMMALFALLAIYAAIRGLEGGRRWTVLAGIAALCAVASKETALVIPLLVVAWDRAFAFPSFKAAWSRRRALYGVLAASWLLFALAAPDLPFFRARGFEQGTARWIYLAAQSSIVPRYLWLSVWPQNLVFDYGPVPQAGPYLWWPGALVMLGFAAAVLVAARRRPALAFWGLWVLLLLAPASGLVSIATEVGAERRMYLPLVGVICILVQLAVLAGRRVVGSGPTWRATMLASATIVILALSVTAARRNDDYKSGLTMWQTVVERRPHWRAREHLSVYLRDAGRIDESIAELRLSAPYSRDSRHALAAALLEQGKLVESLTEYDRLMKIPGPIHGLDVARREYARALLRAGRPADASVQLRLAVAENPGDIRSRVELGDVLRDSGDIMRAVAVYREALGLAPNNLVALVNLGVLLASHGQEAEATMLLQRALTLDPNQPAALMTLVQLSLAAGDARGGEQQARRLVAIAPTNAEAHNLLGVALASQQRIDAARVEFAEAVRLDPANRGAAENLQHALAATSGR
jgi:Flp pilus assembly protein TadD